MRAINFETNKSEKPWAGPRRVRKTIKGRKKKCLQGQPGNINMRGAQGPGLQQTDIGAPWKEFQNQFFKPKYSCGLNLAFLGHMHFISLDTE